MLEQVGTSLDMFEPIRTSWTNLDKFEPIWTSLHQPGGKKPMSIDETYAISKDCRILGQGQDQYE